MTITLATLPQATAQQVFDQIVTHLRKQGVPSKAKISCHYRYNGLMCAAGCLIAEEEYKAEWEGKSWWGLADVNVVPTVHRELICDMQAVHDEMGVDAWESEFKRVATKYNLEYRAP